MSRRRKIATLLISIVILLALVVVYIGSLFQRGETISEIDGEKARQLLYQSIFVSEEKEAFQKVCNELVQTVKDNIGPAQNEPDQNQSNVIKVLKAVVGPDLFRARVRNGMVRRLELDLEIPKSYLPQNATQDDVTLALLGSWQGLLRVESPDRNLRLEKRTGDPFKTLSFVQYYDDMPVYGSWLQMNIEDRSNAFVLNSLSGLYIPDLDLPRTKPTISDRRATHNVMQEYGIKSLPEMRLIVPVKLWIYDQALFAPECPQCPKVNHDPRLAWRVIFESPRDGGAVTDAFVDAITGDLLFQQAGVYYPDIRVFSAHNNRPSSECYKRSEAEAWFGDGWVSGYGICSSAAWCSEPYNHCWWGRATCAAPDTEGRACSDYAWKVYRFFHNEAPPGGRDQEIVERPFRIYVHACSADTTEDCNPWLNANSIRCTTETVHNFGDGMCTMDVLAHEAGHTYHRSFVNYSYTAQSGAIAEHIADAFAHFACCWEENDEDCDWLQLEHTRRAITNTASSQFGCGRDLSDPPRCFSWDAIASTLVAHPDHFTNFHNTTVDNGGVHINAGILNKALYLMVEGGTHHDIPVRSIDEAKVRIIYHAAVLGLPANPSFTDFSDRVQYACNALIGRPHGITSHDCCQVKNAFAAVGVGSPDSDCDETDDWLDTDDDNDGLNDPIDNCQRVPNPLQEDFEGDGIGDACDNDKDNDGRDDDLNDPCPYDANNDADGDGICGDVDNCPNPGDPNPDQKDDDGDGMGNACDPCPGDKDNDSDGDGFCGNVDNCPNVPNPAQADSDLYRGDDVGDARDQVGDACDNCPAHYNPDQSDINGDGLGDECDPDMDGDGVPNGEDLCPEQVGETQFARPGYINRLGCPAIPDPRYFEIQFDRELAESLDPAMAQPILRLPIDLCQFVPCEDGTLFAEGDIVDMVVSLELDLAYDLEMKRPVMTYLAVLDQAGNRVAAGEAYFFSNGQQLNSETELDLSFEILPSYTWSDSGMFSDQKESFAASPAYYLVIRPDIGNYQNAQILTETPIQITTELSANFEK